VDWSNEPYVRMYTRETADDFELSWEALALWRALLCKFDRSGLMEARNGWTSVARATRIPIDVAERAGAELIADGRVRLVKAGILAPNFVAAQTASKSDKVRQRESRDKRRERAVSMQDIESAQTSATVSHAVTQSHTASRNVTLCSADPLLSHCVAEPLLMPRDEHEAESQEPVVLSVQESKPESKPRKHALPDGWTPERSEANLKAEAAARDRGISVREEWLKFVDWTKSNNAKKTDWDATWRNWTRNAKPNNTNRQQQSGPVGQGLLAMMRGEQP
jgi:hypothetical protein